MPYPTWQLCRAQLQLAMRLYNLGSSSGHCAVPLTAAVTDSSSHCFWQQQTLPRPHQHSLRGKQQSLSSTSLAASS